MNQNLLIDNMPIWKCQGCHKVVTRWSQCGHKVVAFASNLLPPCTKYQGCHKSCHKVVTRLSNGYNIVTRLLHHELSDIMAGQKEYVTQTKNKARVTKQVTSDNCHGHLIFGLPK